MRQIYSYAGAALAMAAAHMEAMRYIEAAPLVADFKAPKRHRTGRKYPHSSARQNARIARQLSAGQIKFIEHGPRST